MEILGIVWAASIISPASAAAKSIKEVLTAPTSQHEALLSRESQRFPQGGLATGGSGGAGVSPTTAAIALPQSLRLPFGLFSERHEQPSQTDAFQTLMPTIGNTLTSFEPPAEVPAVAPADTVPQDSVLHGRWHRWSAVAAVRIEPADTSPQAGATSVNQSHCVQTTRSLYQPSALALTASPKAQVWVHNQFIGEVSGQVAARKISTRLSALLRSGQLDPTHIRPLVGNNFVGIGHRGDLLFLVDETLQPHPEVPAIATATQWVNNLRNAFDAAPLEVAEIQMAMQGLQESTETMYGTASWYGPHFHGRQTANGEIFDENALTAAHKTLPFNTRLKVTNRLNGKSVVVRINDRGPYFEQRSLDLSRAAAHCLGSTYRGVIPYEAVILESVPKPDLGEMTTAHLAD